MPAKPAGPTQITRMLTVVSRHVAQEAVGGAFVARAARPWLMLAVIVDLRNRSGLRDLAPETEITMTGERMGPIERVEKRADGDLVRERPAFAAARIMKAEVEVRTGAAKGAHSPMRVVQRNGHHKRDWATRASRIGRKIPKLRKGSDFPGFLEPRRRG